MFVFFASDASLDLSASLTADAQLQSHFAQVLSHLAQLHTLCARHVDLQGLHARESGQRDALRELRRSEPTLVELPDCQLQGGTTPWRCIQLHLLRTAVVPSQEHLFFFLLLLFFFLLLLQSRQQDSG